MACRMSASGTGLYRTSNLPTETSYTMMGWFKITTDRNAYSSFLCLQPSSNSNGLLQTNSNGTSLGWWDSGFQSTGDSLTAGTWYHMAVTAGDGGSTYRIYLNGTETHTDTINSITEARIAFMSNSGSEWLNGCAEAIKVWTVPLTASEVLQEMRTIVPVTEVANLWGWYPLVAGLARTTDWSGRGMTLTQGTGTYADEPGPGIPWSSRTIVMMPVSGGATTMPADSGSYTLTGTAATLKQGYKVTADAGSYTMTGTAATLTKARTITASSGSFLVTGTAATLKQTIISTSDAGSFTVSGTAAALKQTRIMAADSGSFTVTGTAATLLISVTMSATSGSYTVSGTDATLRETVLLPADSGSYAISGTAASLFKGKIIAANSGSYVMTGTAATLKQTILMGADSGSYTVNGTAASLLANEKIIPDSGSYVVTGTAATLLQAKRLTADSGSYIVSGTAATLTYSAAPASTVKPGGMSAAKNTRRSRMRGR